MPKRRGDQTRGCAWCVAQGDPEVDSTRFHRNTSTLVAATAAAFFGATLLTWLRDLRRVLRGDLVFQEE